MKKEEVSAKKADDYLYLPLEHTTSKDPIARILLKQEFNLENGIKVGEPLLMRDRTGSIFDAGIVAGAGSAEDEASLYILTKAGDEYVFRIAG